MSNQGERSAKGNGRDRRRSRSRGPGKDEDKRPDHSSRRGSADKGSSAARGRGRGRGGRGRGGYAGPQTTSSARASSHGTIAVQFKIEPAWSIRTSDQSVDLPAGVGSSVEIIRGANGAEIIVKRAGGSGVPGVQSTPTPAVVAREPSADSSKFKSYCRYVNASVLAIPYTLHYDEAAGLLSLLNDGILHGYLAITKGDLECVVEPLKIGAFSKLQGCKTSVFMPELLVAVEEYRRSPLVPVQAIRSEKRMLAQTPRSDSIDGGQYEMPEAKSTVRMTAKAYAAIMDARMYACAVHSPIPTAFEVDGVIKEVFLIAADTVEYSVAKEKYTDLVAALAIDAAVGKLALYGVS